MQATLKTQFDAQFHGADIEVFKSVLQLAIDRLGSSPLRALSGSPHKAQAGLKGNDLINVKNMITRFANELRMDEPKLEPDEPRTKGEDTADALLFRLLARALIQRHGPTRHMFGINTGSPT